MGSVFFQKTMVRVSRAAQILETLLLDKLLYLHNSVIDGTTRGETEFSFGLLVADAVISHVLEFHLGAPKFNVGEMVSHLVSQVDYANVLPGQGIDTRVRGIQVFHDRISHIAHVQQRPELFPAEYCDLPLRRRPYGQYVHNQIQPYTGEQVTHSENRTETEDDRVLIGQVIFRREV